MVLGKVQGAVDQGQCFTYPSGQQQHFCALPGLEAVEQLPAVAQDMVVVAVGYGALTLIVEAFQPLVITAQDLPDALIERKLVTCR
ncbi:hypothetical protein D3C76_774160 [compost metagenome]